MKRFGQFLLVIFALVCVLMTAAFAEGDVEHTSFVWGTVASLLPPVAAIVLALITKEVYSSLFLGIIVGCFLYTNGSPIDAFQDFVSRLTSNAGGNMGILMFLVILGTMVALMIRAGGSKAYGDWAVSHIKTKSGALWSTFILAIVLGVDDYFNNLTTGNVMRPVTDGHQISLPQAAEFPDVDAAPIPHGHAVHPALPGQMPLPCDFEVFRKDAHGVEILRRHAVPGRRVKDGVRCVFQCGCGKDRRKIGAQLKRHNGVPPLKDGAAVPPGCREEKPGDRSSQYLRSSLQAHRHSHPAKGRGRFDCIQNIRMPPKKQGPFL